MFDRNKRTTGWSGLVFAAAVLIVMALAIRGFAVPSAPGASPGSSLVSASNEPSATPEPDATPVPSESATPEATPVEPDKGPLVGRAWVSYLAERSAVGVIGKQAMLLPAGESALVATRDAVASKLGSAEGSSVLTVRAVPSGEIVAEHASVDSIATAVFAAGAVYFAGLAVDGRDSGVWRLDLATLEVSQAIPSSAWPDATGTRYQLRLSSSGRTLASPACSPSGDGPHTCRVDVLDLSTGVVTHPIERLVDRYVWGVTDSAVITFSEDRSVMAAVEISSGRPLWELRGYYVEDHYGLSDSSGLIVFAGTSDADGHHNGNVLLAVDAQSGAVREVHRYEGDQRISLWIELSDDTTAVVGHGPRLQFAFGSATSVSGEMVDIATGAIQPNAVTATVER